MISTDSQTLHVNIVVHTHYSYRYDKHTKYNISSIMFTCMDSTDDI